MTKSNLVDIDVDMVHETEKAFLVTIDGKTKVWIAKSQCELDTETKVLTCPEWLAKDKGLI